MAFDSFFEASGQSVAGFFTSGDGISIGVDVQGNQVGIKGACQGPAGDGVQGFGRGEFSGVAGFGGAPALPGGPGGTGVVGFGSGSQSQGIRGIGSGGLNIGAGEPAGVFGQGGALSAGVVGTGGPGRSDGVRGIGSADDGYGVVGLGGRDLGIGVLGVGGGVSRTDQLVRAGVYGQDGGAGVAVVGHASSFEPGIGVYGFTFIANGAGVRGDDLSGSGVGVYGSASSAGLAGQFDGPVLVNGDVTINGNATVTGAKSAVVPFPDGSNRRLYAMESPESWFEDFGEGHLADGQAEIQLDPNFASVVNSDRYHVFLTEYDDNNALYVTDRTNAGFSVRAKFSKAAAGTFSYRVVAKRKDVQGPRFEPVVIPEKRTPPRIFRAEKQL